MNPDWNFFEAGADGAGLTKIRCSALTVALQAVIHNPAKNESTQCSRVDPMLAGSALRCGSLLVDGTLSL